MTRNLFHRQRFRRLGAGWLGAVALAFAASAADPSGAPRGSAGSAYGAIPSPALSPDQVVRLQLEALRSNDPADRGIALTFRFASPANKLKTGPLPRFAEMIKAGAYRLMLEYREVEYEPVELSGEQARQRVTLVGTRYAVTYVFHLSRQRHPECNGCWMTDAVVVERVLSGAA